MKVKDLKASPYNPRKISETDLQELKAAMQEFGDLSGIVMNTATGRLVGGHQRVKIFDPTWPIITRAQKDNVGTLALGYVETPYGMWTYREVHWSEAKEQMANIAANKHGGEWDMPKLKDLFAEVDTGEMDFDLTGFTYEEASNIVGYDSEDHAKAVDEVDNQDIAPPENPVTKLGDLIILGEHRLLCGDSTNGQHVLQLLDDAKPHLMVTDPPYGVEYDPEWRSKARKGKGKTAVGAVKGDDQVDWSDAYNLFPGDVAYIWHAATYTHQVAKSIIDCDYTIVSCCIWAKQHFALSRGDYHWQHEPCLYVVKKGAKHHWQGSRKESTLWQIANNNPFGNKDKEEQSGHGTQKPMECMARPIRNNSAKGDLVYDPFGGSGTTLLAAEDLGRVCYMMEIDPAYCDVIISRWEDMTGREAQRP